MYSITKEHGPLEEEKKMYQLNIAFNLLGEEQIFRYDSFEEALASAKHASKIASVLDWSRYEGQQLRVGKNTYVDVYQQGDISVLQMNVTW